MGPQIGSLEHGAHVVVGTPGRLHDHLSRNTLDLSVIPPAKSLSHLPVFVDPSHGTGKRAYVPASIRRS